MSDSQFEQYNNLHIFAKEWRKYKQLHPPIDRDTFRKNMQFDQYVKLEYINQKTNRPMLIYLLEKYSKYSNSSQDLKRLLTKIKEPSDVILVSYAPFKTYSLKTILTFKQLRIKTYLHENFDLIVPNGPLCYPHRILSEVEVNRLLNEELYCNLVNLPKILQEDAQCVWIGAEVGDVVEITMCSDIASESIQYRVVVPKSGKVVSFRDDTNVNKKETKNTDSKKSKNNKSPIKNEENEADEIEDEEITELREAAKNDLDVDDADDVDDNVDDNVDDDADVNNADY